MRKRSCFRWITDTDNQETDGKRDRHRQGRELRAWNRWTSWMPEDEVNKEEELTTTR